MTTDPGPKADPLSDAALAFALLRVAPAGLGGVSLRARIGPVLDTALKGAALLPPPQRRIHPTITDDQLYGGVDLEHAFATGSLRRRRGVIETAGALILPMAERADAAFAARLAQTMDAGDAPPLVMIDEGAAEDERAPETLLERLAFHVDLTDARTDASSPPMTTSAQPARLTADQIETLTRLSAAMGITSLRAPVFAARAASAAAALAGRDAPDDDDLALAIRLVLAPRAVISPLPDEAEDDQPPPPDDQPQESETKDQQTDGERAEDRLTEAEAALLPADLLALMAGPRASLAKAGQGAGARAVSTRRGRPLPSRLGAPGAAGRLDLMATLRAAAPLQKLRGAQKGRLKFQKSDLRLRRYQNHRDRLIIFAVDLSGSAAHARLAEAKGAVELMLTRAYADRDHVALVGFRGSEAEVLLPPTRSLVMTKRRLGDAPGGGGTPLASGLSAALSLAERAQYAGMTPFIVTLTDGRANIALDGQGDRAHAAEDALTQARAIAAAGLGAAVIDTGRRPEPSLGRLAAEMEARYAPLPQASSAKVAATITAALER